MRHRFIGIVVMALAVSVGCSLGGNPTSPSATLASAPTAGSVAIVSVTPPSGTVLRVECTQGVGSSRDQYDCPKVMVNATTTPATVDGNYIVYACLSIDPRVITGGCSGTSVSSAENPKVLRPGPGGNSDFVISFVVYDQGGGSRIFPGQAIPSDALAVEVKPWVFRRP